MTDTPYLTPTPELLAAIDIHELLPQQEPFVMVGRVTSFTDRVLETETVVDAANIFVEDGRFTSTGLIENIAQTCAARIGYINKYILLKGIQVGVIGAIRDLHVSREPRVGETLHTRLEVREEIFGMILADAWVTCGDEEIVSTNIKIALQKEA